MAGKREEQPAPGSFYRHFKNKLYQVLAVATHSETGERMVVYQALYGDFGVYVRPLEMFMSPVDREKYPDAGQEYRFEQVIPQEAEEKGREPDMEPEPEAEPEPMNPHWVGRFLDADTPEQQLAVLRSCSGHITQRELDCICLALDLPSEGETKDMEAQLDSLRQAIRLKQRYSGSRLRRKPKEQGDR